MCYRTSLEEIEVLDEKEYRLLKNYQKDKKIVEKFQDKGIL